LAEVGLIGLNVVNVTCRGAQRGVTSGGSREVGRYEINILPKVELELVVHDDATQKAADTIIEHARTGNIGDGKIFVSPIETAIRIRTGEQNADPMRPSGDGETGEVTFGANHAGGIAGGISTGQPVRVRVAFKPTSSILIPVPTIRKDDTGGFEQGEIVTKGRHDPCVGLRGVPVVEAMMALTLADHFLLNRAQCG